MTLKEFKAMLDNYSQYENATVYVEVEVANEVYLQKPAECIRVEDGFINSSFIIQGMTSEDF